MRVNTPYRNRRRSHSYTLRTCSPFGQLHDSIILIAACGDPGFAIISSLIRTKFLKIGGKSFFGSDSHIGLSLRKNSLNHNVSLVFWPIEPYSTSGGPIIPVQLLLWVDRLLSKQHDPLSIPIGTHGTILLCGL